jgi:LEA14-like dessication related protein
VTFDTPGFAMSAKLRSLFTSARLIAAASLVSALLAGCAGLPPGMQAPSVTIADLGAGDAGLFEQQFNLRLRIQNPNPDEFKIDGIAFDLDINGQSFAKGVGNQLVTVPRYGSAFMSVEAVTTLGSSLSFLIRQFGRFVESNRVIFKYRIRGVLNIAGGSRVPFEETGEFDFGALIPTLPATR